MAPKRRQTAIPGVIGGLGPLAHITFEQRLVAESARRGALQDRDHPMWILVNATDIPDRSASIAGTAPSCVPSLVRYGRLLQSAGADFLIVTCNTAHALHSQVQSRLSIPWIHLIDCTAQAIARDHEGTQRVGVLATDGTVAAGLYQQSLRELGLAPIAPSVGSEVQKRVMDAIYSPDWGVKSTGTEVSGRAQRTLLWAIGWLALRGAELVVAGCTEVSVALRSLPEGCSPMLPWIDPLDVAARTTLDLAYQCLDSGGIAFGARAGG